METHIKIFLLKEYTDCQPYEDKLTKLFLTKEDAIKALQADVCSWAKADWDSVPEKLSLNLGQEDIFEPEYVRIHNVAKGYTTYFVVDELTVWKEKKQMEDTMYYLQAKASYLSKLNQSIKADTKKLSDLCNEMGQNWDSRENLEGLNNIAGMITSLREYSRNLDKYIAYLLTSAEAYKETK